METERNNHRKLLPFEFNPFTSSLKTKGNIDSSMNWHDYAELRKPTLPNIFHKEVIKSPEKERKSPKLALKKGMHHKSWYFYIF